ncbi:hypothetical protein [Hyunsoonleella aestuarii]|uniref:Uncharacterized protein n=1 Tax=Hyunsoonleella aestuarii TaxID=912802 RepID=A0ABP8E9P2_9FLAO|nr:hypothetical protein [Hyunsoonleella aestuarii]
MKKIALSTFFAGLLLFNSCSSSDDENKPLEECQTCNLEILGESITSEICDNGDGTITLTTLGQEEVEELDEGVTFAQFIAAFEEFGATCN